jgi:hypothetical protein
MKWVRRIVVCLFSIVLLVSLIGIALATSARVSLMHPNKTENWLNQSNLYANLETTVVNQAQTAIANNVSGGVSISQSVVQQAVQSAFPQSLLKQNVQTFLTSNYAWLEGKTPTPNFKIDLSGVKQEFATKVADASVLAHLTGLPTCTAAQTLQLESANPLLLSCLPAGVSPQFEASQVSQQVISNSGFLSHPVITANSVSTKGLSMSGQEAYYKKFSRLPRSYQLIQKLPWILSIVGIFSILGIVFCSRSKRLGVRRISIVLLIGGVLLVIDKFVADIAFNKLKNRAFKGVSSSQIQQSLTSFAHYVETEISKVNLWFGIAYIILAVILFVILIATRHRQMRSTPKSIHTPAKQTKVQSTVNNLRAANRPQRRPDYVDSLTPNNKPRKGPRPPRLIQ